ncbi:MAG: hypothetical protein IKO34_08145 [Bacteroidales bacterium]|nr:hypothetical protein [Bacteroidales bacterium]
MKNFKIAMILVAAVAFFCSCGEKTVTVNVTEKNDVVTYDLSSAASLPIELTCTVNADAGIKTIELSRTIMNGETVVKTEAYELENADFEGKADFSFPWADTLLKADLAAGYTVEYKVTAADKKDNQDSKIYPINVVETATPISANWSDPIALSNQSWATYTGVTTITEQNETIGVKCLGKNDHKAYNLYAEPTTGASWVFVTNIDNLTTNEALVEAYNNGEKVTGRTMFPATDEGKGYEEKYFICKNKDGEYVLVDYVAGRMNSGATNTTGIGNVMVFKYKKAETPAPAAK